MLTDVLEEKKMSTLCFSLYEKPLKTDDKPLALGSGSQDSTSVKHSCIVTKLILMPQAKREGDVNKTITIKEKNKAFKPT